MQKPNLKTLQAKYKNAKTVRCLINEINIDVTAITEFEYDEVLETWTSVGGAICFWKAGNYAEIVNTTSKKTCKCAICDCDKSKIVNRKT